MLSKIWYAKIKDDLIWSQLKKAEAVLAGAKADLPLLYKLRVAEMVLRLKKRFHKKFGLFIILGWQPKWNKRYADIQDISQDIFRGHHISIFEIRKRIAEVLGDDKFIARRLKSLINFDGAILIDRHGIIVDSGVYIEGLRPKLVIEKLYPDVHRPDLSAGFGFKKKVHARHLAAITASYIFKGTTVYTVSEETGDFHVFEEGKIVYSTVKGEGTNKKPRH